METNLDIVKKFLKNKAENFRDVKIQLDKERAKFEKQKEKRDHEKKYIRQITSVVMRL